MNSEYNNNGGCIQHSPFCYISFTASFLKYAYAAKHIMICKTVEQGVASPILNSEPFPVCCMMNAIGILTRKALQMPSIITNLVSTARCRSWKSMRYVQLSLIS